MSEGLGNIGLEEKLWKAADKLRGSVDSSEYKHIVLGLIFLKYISDKFQKKYNELVMEGKDLENELTEYTSNNIFSIPKEARWDYIRDNAENEKIGQLIDSAMIHIERENEILRNVLEKRYSRPEIDKRRLGELINLITTINPYKQEEVDTLGRIYEYFLGKFADKEGKKGGEFYTPPSIVKTLVGMIEPFKGLIYDPCCGSGGMFVQSKKFVEEHKGKTTDLSIYGQELNATTWKISKMNLAVRGIEADLGEKHADTFHNDIHKNIKADYILANPPFNISDWGGDKLNYDVRWEYGIPPAGNANFAWLQHIIYHLSPNGIAGIVLANGSLSSSISNEREIRKNLLEANLVDCIVAMPDKLFYSTSIPVSLWIIDKNKNGNKMYRNRKEEILFIDARQLGEMVNKRHKELKEYDITKITNTYRQWRNAEGNYQDINGFSKSVKLEKIREYGYVLSPGRYVGIEKIEDNGVSFEEKIDDMSIQLTELFIKSRQLEQEIKKNLRSLRNE